MPPKRRRTRAPPIIETSERAEQVQVQSGNTAQSGSATNPNTQVSPSSVEGSSTGSSFVDLGAGGSFSPQGTADLPPDEPPSDPSDPESSDSSSLSLSTFIPPSNLSDSEPEFEETTIMSVSFGSLAIEVQDTPMAVSDRQPLYTKEDRAKLAADKLLDLHKQATAKAHEELVHCVADGVGLSHDIVTSFKTTIWEDNNGALTLANLEPGRIAPRSKHYGVKVHWFRSHLVPDKVVVKKIDTSEQKADILTKSLSRAVFEHIWFLLCGW